MLGTRENRRGLVGALIVAAGLVGVAGPAGESIAQERVIIARGGPMGGAGSGQVSRRSVERYSELLGFGAEQRESAMTIHEGYASEMDQVRKTQRSAFEDARRASEDTGDHGVFMEKMPKIETEFKAASDRLEKALFADLRALLSTPEQEEKWAGVERMRRREVGLRGASLSGEGVDLIDLVAGLKPEPESSEELRAVLDEYELQLDRALEAKIKAMGEAPQFGMFGGPDEKSMEKMQEAAKVAKEVGKRIQEINVQNGRKIGGLLADASRAAFEEELRRRSFPRVYRPSRVTKDLEGAMGLSDLTSDQREQLTSLRTSYERDLAGVNDRWANAIKENEGNDQEGTIATGAGVMRFSMGEEPEALKEAKKARREVDEKAADRIKSILTAAQREKLPKAPAGREDGDGEFVGQTMVIETVDH
ncbi:hypothetical protein PHYC_03085 [Phycisphaerales bacterium]|nr:hypothetical protein PHYC_03085 [Phycisphaerales bacterium]